MRVLNRTKSLGLFVATVAAAGLVPLTAGTADAAPVAAAAAGGSCPAAGTVTQWWNSGHDGVDIANSRGTAIYATGAGTVIASGPASGYGQWIRIRHDDGTITEYGHMYERLVSVNQRVSAGQHIARMGSEGDSTGNHLHLRTYASASASRGMNPVDYLSARGVGLPCTPGGGGETPGTNFTTWGTSVRVRADARLNAAVVRTLTGPTPVYVECQKHGDTVTAEGYTNDAWSYIPALGGYITNIYIDNPAAWLPGVREC